MAHVTRSYDGRTGRSWKRSTSSCETLTRRPYKPRSALRAGELSRLLPDLAQRVGELPLPVAADPDTERHRLHTAVADLLAGVGRTAPLVVVIEDGHWADTPTLLLLRHLARGASDARVLLVTTFRDTEAEVPEALSAALVDLRRSEGVVRLRLGGLSAEEISEFVRRAVGGDFGPDLPEIARVLSESTGGNAFLMTELWRTLLESETVSVHDGGRGWRALLPISAARRACERSSATGWRG